MATDDAAGLVPESLRSLLADIGMMVVLSARLEAAVRYMHRRVSGAEELDPQGQVENLVKGIRKVARTKNHSTIEIDNVNSWARNAERALVRRGRLVHALWHAAATEPASDSHAGPGAAESLFMTLPRLGKSEGVDFSEIPELNAQMQHLLRNATSAIAKQAGRIGDAPARQELSGPDSADLSDTAQ